MNNEAKFRIKEYPLDQFPNPPSSSSDVKPSYVLIVNEYLLQNKLSEACYYLEAIQTFHSQDQLFLAKLGHISFKLKKFRESESYYLNALNCSQTQHLEEIWFGLAQLYFSIKNYKQCISAFLSLLLLNPTFKYSSLCYLKLGISSSKLKDFENSLNYLEKSLIKNDLPIDLKAVALCHLGSVKQAMGKDENINGVFKEAAEFIRNFLTGICLCWVYMNTDPIKVLNLCNKMVSESSIIEEITDLKLFKAIALIKMSKYEEAGKILNLLTRRYPNNLVYGQYLAILFYKTGNYVQAGQVLEYLKLVWPFHLNVMVNYVRIMRKLQRFSESETTKMQIMGILMIHSYTNDEILEFLDERSSELNEPVFVLTDCPISLCPDYNILEEFNRII